MEDRVRIAGIQPSRMRGMTAMYHRRFFLDVNLTTVLILVLFVVFVAIVVAMTTGDFSGEGSWILDNPWGRMSLIDIYVGIALFAGWVFPREGSLPRSSCCAPTTSAATGSSANSSQEPRVSRVLHTPTTMRIDSWRS
jgi:hypothetical protein